MTAMSSHIGAPVKGPKRVSTNRNSHYLDSYSRTGSELATNLGSRTYIRVAHECVRSTLRLRIMSGNELRFHITYLVVNCVISPRTDVNFPATGFASCTRIFDDPARL